MTNNTEDSYSFCKQIREEHPISLPFQWLFIINFSILQVVLMYYYYKLKISKPKKEDVYDKI